MRYELWGTPDRTSLTFTGAEAISNYKRQGAVEPDAKLIWTVDADSYNEASTLYHEYMGWEPYRPMDEHVEERLSCMNISTMSQTLFYLIEQQPDSQKTVDHLRQQTDFYHQNPLAGSFYRVFTAMPRFVGKHPVDVPADIAFALRRIRPGFSVEGWTMDRLARVWWLLQLPADDEIRYVGTITQLFRAGELNELVALYSALPVLAYPEAWWFQATEGIRNNIADVQSAIMLHNPYPADYFDEPAWNQMVLKAFFTDKDVMQITGLDERKNARLARTLADYAAERRAAGRSLPSNIERLMSL